MADAENNAELAEAKAAESPVSTTAGVDRIDSGTAPEGSSAVSPTSRELAASGSGALGSDDEEKDNEEEEEVEGHAEQELVGIASNEVKNIILQVLSPYFEDDGSDGGDDEDTAQRYDHLKCKTWIQLICDGILERLMGLAKPYKYVAHCMIMRKCGAGMHVCSSCFYGAADGWVSHAHDLSAHIYAVVTVYWCAI